MVKNKNTVIKIIQVVLWAALAVMFYCTEFMGGKWQSGAFSAIAFTLICLYSYKKNPTRRHLTGSLITCAIMYAAIIISYFLDV